MAGPGFLNFTLGRKWFAETLNSVEEAGETYGASQRGGSVMSHVRVSEKWDPSVLIPAGEAHIIIGFEPLETLRIARKYAGADTVTVYDPRPVYPLGVLQGVQTYPPLEELQAEIASLSSAALAVPAADGQRAGAPPAPGWKRPAPPARAG